MTPAIPADRPAAGELADSCWEALLRLAEAVKQLKAPLDFCSLRYGASETVLINGQLEPLADCFVAIVALNPEPGRLPELESGAAEEIMFVGEVLRGAEEHG